MNYRNVEIKDLDAVVEIMNLSFSPAEAATKEIFKKRIELIPDSFFVVEDEDKRLVGYVVGPVITERYLNDNLFKETVPNPAKGGYQAILSIAVHPEYRSYGVAGGLLKKLEESSRRYRRRGITLTCHRELIPFYEARGFKNDGLSQSKHAGETWYNMVRDF